MTTCPCPRCEDPSCGAREPGACACGAPLPYKGKGRPSLFCAECRAEKIKSKPRTAERRTSCECGQAIAYSGSGRPFLACETCRAIAAAKACAYCGDALPYAGTGRLPQTCGAAVCRSTRLQEREADLLALGLHEDEREEYRADLVAARRERVESVAAKVRERLSR